MNNITRRDFVRRVSSAAALAAVAPLVPIEAHGQATAKSASGIDPMTLVHPELRPTVQAILKAIPPHNGEVTPAQLAEMRKPTPLLARPQLPQPLVVERKVPGRAGSPDVRVFVINAKAGTTRPAILHTHGGGFIAGAAVSDIRPLQVMARELDCVVVTVDYRLAPETPFPGSLEDSYAGLKWLYANANELGADRARIAVAGESAGGGHAAILAIAARDRGEVPIMFQSLVYPMLDDRTGSTVNPPAHIGTFLWTRELNRFGWTSFLGKAAGSGTVPAGAVPARVENLTGLASAWIGVGAIDLFVDEDIEYARRLIAAGVPTELVVVPGAPHGFDFVQSASISKQFTLARYNALARAFGVKQLEAVPAQ